MSDDSIPTPLTDSFVFESVHTERDQKEITRLLTRLKTAEDDLTIEKAQADTADQILGKLQELHGCCREMVLHWCEWTAKRSDGLQKMRAERDKARDDLAAVRAELEQQSAASCTLLQTYMSERDALRVDKDSLTTQVAGLEKELAGAIGDLHQAGNDIAEAEHQRDETRRESISTLDLVSHIRFALGDDGKRMQDELIEYCMELCADKARLDWLEPVILKQENGSRFRSLLRGLIDGHDFRAAIDAARASVAKEGEK